VNARRRALGALFMITSVSGCARAPASAGSSTMPAASESAGATTTETMFEGSLATSLEAADADFAIALDSGLSCDMVAPLRDRICMLADRVCALSGESPEDLTMQAQCADGAERCLRATEAVRRRCGP
jgi:hypothetical protein